MFLCLFISENEYAYTLLSMMIDFGFQDQKQGYAPCWWIELLFFSFHDTRKLIC